MGKRITRRALLQGAAWAGLSAATAPKARATGVLGGLLASTYDVVVVGAGSTGMSAALGARRADPTARIALLEAKPTHGGTSFRSGGRIWIPNNSDIRAAGIADPRPMALRYMAKLSYPDLYDVDHPLLGLSPRHHAQLAAYYDNGAEIFDHYRAAGILDWEAERWQKFPWNADPLGLEGQLAPDYHPELEENVPKRGRAVLVMHIDPTHLSSTAVPVPNWGVSLAGIDLAQWLFLACVRSGIEIHVASRATDLLVRRVHGRTVVDGLRVATMVNDIETPIQRTIRARRGVVFTSGGFSKNRPRLDATFTGDRHFNGGGSAVTSAQGDFVDMAEQYGFKLEHMDKAWFIENLYEQYKLDPDSLTQANYLLFQAYWLNGDSMLVVNRRGVRVVNEKINYNDRAQAHFHPDNRFLFCVFDQHTLEHYLVGLGGGVTPIVTTMVGPARSAVDLRDKLLRRMRSDPQLRSFGLKPDFVSGFDATVTRFNQFARAGHDADFHRGETSLEIWWHALSLYFENVSVGPVPVLTDPISANVDEHGVRYPNPTMRPLQPPFYAVILSQGLQDTKGGPAIDEGGRVLDLDERPVTGLFGAGNAIASPAAAGYWGAGGTLGPAVVFGHIAGRNAVQPGEVRGACRRPALGCRRARWVSARPGRWTLMRLSKALRRCAVPVALTLLLVAAGCGDDSDDASTTTTAGSDTSVKVPDGIQVGAGMNDPKDPQIAVLQFLPAKISVEVGTKVTWDWNGTEPHSVTFLTPGQELPDPGSDTSVFAPTPATGPIDGSAFVNSGLLPLGPDAPPPFDLSFSKAGTYSYHCVIHPQMVGEVTVTDAGGAVDTPKDVAERRADETAQWLKEGRDAKAEFTAVKPLTKKNDDGSTTWTITMGTSTAHTDILGFTPTPAGIKAGDTVTFLNSSGAPHTASFFGTGAEAITSPLDPRTDPPAPGPSPQTLAAAGFFNTGLLPPDAPPGAGPPEAVRSFSFKVPAAGTYGYVCILHASSSMAGTIDTT